MKIDRPTYNPCLHEKTGAYIHRYYLPEDCRRSLQSQDLDALYETMLEGLCSGKDVESFREEMLAGPCSIRYRVEGLVKEIPLELLEPAVDACIRYYRERHDFKLTKEEIDFLVALNERLRKYEHDINAECDRLDREMQGRVTRGELFAEDYEIGVELRFQLHDSYPLSTDNDGTFIHVRHGMLGKRIQENYEDVEMDWNDARGATNLLIRNNPLFHVPHCWLFHDLQSHSPVPPKHLCRIGTILVEIKVKSQRTIEILNP